MSVPELSAVKPYYASEGVELHLGDCRELLPVLDIAPDAAICDPPYGSTSLEWDTWPTGWTQAVAGVTSSMWCFGSLRMFMARTPEFAASGWKLSHDVVWQKQNGAGFQTDRFRCVHELVSHWYRSRWSDVHHETPVTTDATRRRIEYRKATPTATFGSRGGSSYRTEEGGPRLRTTVLDARNEHLRGFHPTQKPTALLAPLIEYAVPPGGLVLDPMAGSCSTAVAARLTGRRAVCIEAHEPYLEVAARRLDQDVLTMGDPT